MNEARILRETHRELVNSSGKLDRVQTAIASRDEVKEDLQKTFARIEQALLELSEDGAKITVLVRDLMKARKKLEITLTEKEPKNEFTTT